VNKIFCGTKDDGSDDESEVFLLFTACGDLGIFDLFKQQKTNNIVIYLSRVFKPNFKLKFVNIFIFIHINNS